MCPREGTVGASELGSNIVQSCLHESHLGTQKCLETEVVRRLHGSGGFPPPVCALSSTCGHC